MTTVLDPVKRDADTERPRLCHVYLPYSMVSGMVPPVGAVSLCGFVHKSRHTRHINASHPDACLVCLDLLRGLR